MGYPFWKAVWQYVPSLVFLPFDLVSPLLGNYPKGKMRNVDKHLEKFIAVLERQCKQQLIGKLFNKTWYITILLDSTAILVIFQ